MPLRIRPIQKNEIEDIVQLSLLAWAPVFESFEEVLGSNIYGIVYPEGINGQRSEVEKICNDDKYTVYVADADDIIVGFIAYEMDFTKLFGEVQMLAVHPEYQKHGIGTALNQFALDKMKQNGMKLAELVTGGDSGHAPARRSYEKAGYTALPLVRYYKDLSTYSGFHEA